MHRTRSTLFILLLLTSASLSAQPLSNGYSALMLLRSSSAREAGMSGAYAAAVNEPNAIFVNPAALQGQAERPVISSTASLLGLSRSLTRLCAAYDLSEGVGAGVGIIYYNGGEFNRTDAAGNSMGTASYGTFCVQAGMGFNIASASFGACAKAIQSSVSGEDIRGTGYAFDLGARIPFAGAFLLGVSALNIGSITWNNSNAESSPLPWSLRAGISTEIGRTERQTEIRTGSLGKVDTVMAPSATYVLLSLEAQVLRGTSIPTISVGSEIALSDLLAVRAGFALISENSGQTAYLPSRGLAGGVSYRFMADELPFQLSVDYAVGTTILSPNGLTHTLSLDVAL